MKEGLVERESEREGWRGQSEREIGERGRDIRGERMEEKER